MSTHPKTFLTPEEYLAIERKAEYKSEYYNGEMFAMAGATPSHNLIVANAVGELRARLRSRGCRVYPSDMRVRVEATGLHTYPDVIALCGEPRYVGDTLLNPALIIEVLSPSTEAYDRGRKFEHYKKIDSLQEYVLLAADRIAADVFTRQDNGRWLLASCDQLDGSIELLSLDCRLPLAELYYQVNLT